MIKKIFFQCFFVILGIFFMSCGLDTVLSVAEPTVTGNNPLYSGDDFLLWYCSFVTNESEQDESFSGTEIYYKIYNNNSNLRSQRDAILSVNTTSNGTAAANRMIESYTYQPLGMSKNYKSPFIPATNRNVQVIFRVKTYKDNDSHDKEDDIERFRSCIKRNNVCEVFTDENVSQKNYVVPFRNGNVKSFDFFDYDENDDSKSRDVIPVEGDSDYYHSTSPSEQDTYYVQFFAVGVAFDQDTLSNTYSLVLDLGSVPIRKDE